MRGNRVLRGLKFAVMIVLGVAAFGFAVEYLWNWLAPAIFGWRQVSFVQALGLLVLSKILFGGFHRGGGRGGRWGRKHMDERWANMSAEERERFRAGMRGWRGCYKGSPSGLTEERTEV